VPDNLYERNGVFYARIQVAGRDVRRSLKTGSKAEAKRRLKAMLAQLSPYHGTARRSVTDVLDAALLDAKGHLKEKTLDRYTQSALILNRHFTGFFDAIDRRAVLDFIEARKADGVSIRTIKNDLSVLSVAAEYAIEHDLAGTNPVTQIGKRSLRYKPSVFVLPPDADIELVLSSVAGPLEQLCRLLRHTGMRRDEAVNLRWQDVDMKRGAATLPITKAGTSRTVSLSAKALEILKGRPRQIATDLIFTRNDGQPYTGVSQGWREAVYRALKKRPKLQRFRLHDLRHIYAIEYLRDGGNLYVLQKQLGHGSIRQTEWYLQFLTPDEQEKVKSQSAQNPAQLHRFTVAGGAKNG